MILDLDSAPVSETEVEVFESALNTGHPGAQWYFEKKKQIGKFVVLDDIRD